MTNKEQLKSISTPSEFDWIKISEEWEREDLYLEKSTRIALSVLAILRERNMTKQELADRMGVSAQFVSKIVRGNENLTLETITKIEKALDCSLIHINNNVHFISVAESNGEPIDFSKIVFSNNPTKVYRQSSIASYQADYSINSSFASTKRYCHSYRRSGLA